MGRPSVSSKTTTRSNSSYGCPTDLRVSSDYLQRFSSLDSRAIAIDVEATGLDVYHGCKPFYIATCDTHGKVRSWYTDVDPMTREPKWKPAVIRQIQKYISDRPQLYHNAKFDRRMLRSVGIDPAPWEWTFDTHSAAHVLKSDDPGALKELALLYCDIDMDDQDQLRKAVNDARREAKSYGWMIADEGVPQFAGRKKPDSGWWALDMWVPRAVALHRSLPKEHFWWRACAEYGDTDVLRTVALAILQVEALTNPSVRKPPPRGLWDQYWMKLHLLRITEDMENHGVSVRTSELSGANQRHKKLAQEKKRKIRGHSKMMVQNPNSSTQISKFLFHQEVTEELEPYAGKVIKDKLVPIHTTDKGAWSTKSDHLQEYLEYVNPNGRIGRLISDLLDYRTHNKAEEYLTSYQRYGIPTLDPDFITLHPWFNTCGTDTTRFSSSNPNAQNITKKKKINLRRVFCPRPGFLWYAIDYSNIELRIFAYLCGDPEMKAAFERGESVHILFAKLLHPELVAECERKGLSFKDEYKSTWYQWVKNGNFALIYGAGPERADNTYHVKGAYDTIRSQMPYVDQFMEKCAQRVRARGYVKTLGGYNLFVPRDRPHCAPNYTIQGSAGVAISRAMIRLSKYLHTLRDHRMLMQVHDELVIEVPDAPWPERKPVLQEIVRLMELSGKDFGFDLPVEVDEIRTSWGEGQSVDHLLSA